MEEFINALTNSNINEILPILNRITKHINNGYLTLEDKIFLDYGLPLMKISTNRIKLILKKEKKENKNGNN